MSKSFLYKLDKVLKEADIQPIKAIGDEENSEEIEKKVDKDSKTDIRTVMNKVKNATDDSLNTKGRIEAYNTAKGDKNQSIVDKWLATLRSKGLDSDESEEALKNLWMQMQAKRERTKNIEKYMDEDDTEIQT